MSGISIEDRKKKIINELGEYCSLFESPSHNGIQVLSALHGCVMDKIIIKNIPVQIVCGFFIKKNSCKNYNISDFYESEGRHSASMVQDFLSSFWKNNFLSVMLSAEDLLNTKYEAPLKDAWKTYFSIYNENPLNIIFEEENGVINKYFAACISKKENIWFMSQNLDFKNDKLCFYNSRKALKKNDLLVSRNNFSKNFSDIVENLHLKYY